MRIRYVSILAVCLAVASQTATAAPPEVPKTIQAAPSQLIRIPVKSATEIGYCATFSDEEAFFDELAPQPGVRRFIFQAAKPGRYSVAFWTKGETTGTHTTIIVGGPAPPPDDNVDPKPSELLVKFQTAYSTDVQQFKGDATALAALVKAMDAAALIATDPKITTRAALVDAVRTQTTTLVGTGKFPALARAIGDYLNATVGTDDIPLTQELRVKYATAYKLIATTLRSVK